MNGFLWVAKPIAEDENIFTAAELLIKEFPIMWTINVQKSEPQKGVVFDEMSTGLWIRNEVIGGKLPYCKWEYKY